MADDGTHSRLADELLRGYRDDPQAALRNPLMELSKQQFSGPFPTLDPLPPRHVFENYRRPGPITESVEKDLAGMLATPYAAGRTGGEFGANAYEAMRYLDPAKAGAAGLSALELATMLGLPGAPVRIPKPIRVFHAGPHEFAPERLIRRPDGSLDYIVGTPPDKLPNVPPGHEAVQDFPLGRFRMDKVNTGQGAQTYGHGIYQAENEAVARDYYNQLVRAHPAQAAADRALEMAKGDPDGALRYLAVARSNDPSSSQDYARAARIIHGKEQSIPPAHMYESDLHARPEQFLDWDRPLSGQSAAVRDVLPIDVWNQVHHPANRKGYGDTAAAQAFSEAGIPGIRYPDENSRATPTWFAKDSQGGYARGFPNEADARVFVDRNPQFTLEPPRSPTSNYVVWSPEIIDILSKYVMPPAIAGPALATALSQHGGDSP